MKALVLVCLLINARLPSQGGLPVIKPAPIIVEGRTMGTSYRIIYFDDHGRNFKTSIDSLLFLVNKSISTYDGSSEVSLFNKSKKGIAFSLPYLYPVLKKAMDVAHATAGAFDPTVMPLVNAWGFGPAGSTAINKKQIDSLRNLVGYQKIHLRADSVKKSDPRVQLDFGGIGQGYGADVVAAFLKSKNITNFLIELGGEGLSAGKNLQKDTFWTIGILDPNSTRENQFFKAYVTLKDKSYTTAGNYFNYRIIDGRKYGHTIDPATGYPAVNALLSVSVFTSDCVTADAWDTALMVAGLEKSIALLKSQPTLEAFLIFSTAEGKIETYCTPGLEKFIVLEP